jgi:light-regulated signal transduction histidine kinase (bacteriophytochrome)
MSFKTKSSARQYFFKLLFGPFILSIAFFAFYLDVLTQREITFDICYFPAIMLMVWNFGDRAGYLMASITALLWFMAQRPVEYLGGIYAVSLDALFHWVAFLLVARMTGRVRDQSLELERKTKELTRSNQELEHFASKAAHDLQAPLANVFGFTELLQAKYKSAGDEQTNGYIEHILKGVRRMSDFIRALLEYARVMKPDGSSSIVELNGVMKEVLDSLQLVIAQKKARVSFDSLPKVRVNPALIGLLFQNLITNAMKYCEKEPEIHIHAAKKDEECLFSIKDNGIGIPAESRERIFIMFEKLATKQQYPGSGIGLATCQKIVERYGGRIWVESPSGEGSTFYFTLPAV